MLNQRSIKTLFATLALMAVAICIFELSIMRATGTARWTGSAGSAKAQVPGKKNKLSSRQSAKSEGTEKKNFTDTFTSDSDTSRRKISNSAREASQLYLRKRLPKDEKELPVEKYFEAQDQMRKMSVFSTAQNRAMPAGSAATASLMTETTLSEAATWTALGPGNIGGRTRALVVNPTNPNIMYAASVSGGVWKTTNGGASWNPISDMIANLAVCSLVIDPTNPNVIYAGTGEGYFNQDSVRGAGIFKSSDSGNTWGQLTGTRTPDFYFVNDIVVSPASNQRLYAATSTGVWRTTNGGTTWTKVLDPKNASDETLQGGCFDLAIRTDQPSADVVFTSCGMTEQASIYRSKNAGGNEEWMQVLTKEGMGRTAIAIAPSNQNIVYAVAASYSDLFRLDIYDAPLNGVFRSTAGGDPGTWTTQTDLTDDQLSHNLLSLSFSAFAENCGAEGRGSISHGWYDLAIAVDPINPNSVWVGGIDLFRSDDGGVNWGIAGLTYVGPNYAKGPLHPNQHLITFHPQYNGTSNQTLFTGNDGGIFRTSNARAAVATGPTAPCKQNNVGVSWTSLNNGYAVTQFNHGLPRPDGSSYFGGTQGNGTILGTDARGTNGWREIISGDGGFVAVDHGNSNIIMYASLPLALPSGLSGAVYKSTDGGGTFSDAGQVFSGYNSFNPPLMMDPSDPLRLWFGGRHTINGASHWSDSVCCFYDISAIAIAPSDANYVLAGGDGGHLTLFDDGLSDEPSYPVSESIPREGYISWIAFDPNNKNTAYSTYSTFGGGHVFRSSDAGNSWVNISGNLPDIPVHCIVVDPSNVTRLYIGTDLGVFVSNDGGGSWLVENTGFPNVITQSLSFQVVNGVTTLYAFTHGRGAWRVVLNNNGCNYALSPATVTVGSNSTSGSVNVSALPAGCNWTSSSNESWIKITGDGSGRASYSIEANPYKSLRIGTATIAGRSFSVYQAASPNTDTSPPEITLVNPSPSGILNTSSNALLVTLRVINGCGYLTWSSDRGYSKSLGNCSSVDFNGLSSSFNVQFAIGLNNLTFTARDLAGNYARTSLKVNYRPDSLILSVAGIGISGFSGDGSLATSAQLSIPAGLALDAAGNIYLADRSNNRIRKINAVDGKISTVAGSGAINGTSGDGGPATSARLESPNAIAVDHQGNLYIADTGNNRIRKVFALDGRIITIAGTGGKGYNGDGGLATSSLLNDPSSMALDAAGNVYVADRGNNRIRKITLADGKITTIAGTGASGFSGDGGPAILAQLWQPIGLAIDATDSIYIADSKNYRIRKIAASNGVITTLAGDGVQGRGRDGVAAMATQLDSLEGICVDQTNNVFITESSSSTSQLGRVRKIAASDSTITTIAGGGDPSYNGDLREPTSIGLLPIGVAADAAGRVYLTDRRTARILTIVSTPIRDNTPPNILVTAPTTSETFTTMSSPLTLSGTTFDDSGVTGVLWSNDRGGGGFASGTAVWNVPSIPLYIGTNNIRVSTVDLNGNSAQKLLRLTFNPPQIMLTLAGTGVIGSNGDNSPAVIAQLWEPAAIAIDTSGNTFIADARNHRIRKVSPGGLISNFAGNGIVGSSGDGGAALEANLNEPRGVIVDSAGNLFIADTQNHRIRRVASNGRISTIAGTGVQGDIGDGSAATAAQLNFPYGLSLDSAGNLYIADRGNHRVRKVNASDGRISTVAGNGLIGFSGDGGPAIQASIYHPSGVAVDRSGNLYIADQYNHRVRKVGTDGRISTIAGTGTSGFNGDAQPASNARLTSPTLLTVDAAGDVYIADTGNSRVRKITISNGQISTLAGNGIRGLSGDCSSPTTAQLNQPTGVALDSGGNLFIADQGNQRIRKTVPANSLLTAATVSAASFLGTAVSGDSIVAAFGSNLATTTQTTSGLPLPTTIANTTVLVRDSNGVERYAPLFFVSPRQINFLLPGGTSDGTASIVVKSGEGALSLGTAVITPVAPGLFTANASGQGVPAAIALRIKADGSQVFEPVTRFDPALGRFVALPIDLGPVSDQVFLLLYGTGWRNRSSLTEVVTKIGEQTVETSYAGPQGDFVGLDQINARLPRSLIGRGGVEVAVTVDGVPANTVRVNIK